VVRRVDRWRRGRFGSLRGFASRWEGGATGARRGGRVCLYLVRLLDLGRRLDLGALCRGIPARPMRATLT
jgi:hypothetical protein